MYEGPTVQLKMWNVGRPAQMISWTFAWDQSHIIFGGNVITNDLYLLIYYNKKETYLKIYVQQETYEQIRSLKNI